MIRKKHIFSAALAMLTALISVCPLKAEAEEYPYYKLQDEIVLPDGGYNLNTDYIGIKTIKVNEALFGTTSARYGTDTAGAVKKFQADNGLEATGEVDLATWLKLGYTEEDWYGLGTYTHPILTTKYSRREDIVNAMLLAAKENADEGTIYRVGCSGPAGSYTDCSGLIFQCLYAAGINPEKNIVDHALAIYEYTSRNMEADPMLGVRVSKDEIEPGDLVFYHLNGVVCHVGILTGNGKMYDSWPKIGVTYRNYTSGGNILCFKRILPDYDEYLGEIPDNSITGKGIPAGADSMVIYENPGDVIFASDCDICVAVSADGTVTDISVSRDLVVPDGGFVLSATGAHGEWLFENAAKGFGLFVEDDLVYTEEFEVIAKVEELPEEEVTVQEDPVLENAASISERIYAFFKERGNGGLITFSLFD